MDVTTTRPSTIELPGLDRLGEAPPEVSVAREVSQWLAESSQTQAEPEAPLTWHPGWSRTGVALRSPEHLATLISTLPDTRFGGVSGPVAGRRVQVMRVSARWIVEVWHETFDWPDRVYRGTQRNWPGMHHPQGQLSEIELFNSMQAADIAWSWLRRAMLPAGLSHTSEYYAPGR